MEKGCAYTDKTGLICLPLQSRQRQLVTACPTVEECTPVGQGCKSTCVLLARETIYIYVAGKTDGNFEHLSAANTYTRHSHNSLDQARPYARC